MTNDVVPFFVPFFVKCLFKCFTHFYRIGSLLFFWSILYIPHTCPLSDTYRKNIFSQFLACLCIFKFIDLFFYRIQLLLTSPKSFFLNIYNVFKSRISTQFFFCSSISFLRFFICSLIMFKKPHMLISTSLSSLDLFLLICFSLGVWYHIFLLI